MTNNNKHEANISTYPKLPRRGLEEKRIIRDDKYPH